MGWATRRAARAGLFPGEVVATGTPREARRAVSPPAMVFSMSEPCVRSGLLFLALLHATDPDRFPLDPTGCAHLDCDRAFERARSAYGVPVLLDASCEQCLQQEKLVLTYLAELRQQLPKECAAAKRKPTSNDRFLRFAILRLVF